MIPRKLANKLAAQLREYSLVTVLGPRQSGKTTLVHDDPCAFMQRFPAPAIFDVIQRAPHLWPDWKPGRE